MAKDRELGQKVDPLAFTREDEYMGARIPTKDQNGVIRFRRKGRMAGPRDRLLMAQMKSGIAAMWSDGIEYKEIAERISDRYNLEGDLRISAHGIAYHIKKMLDYWRQKGLALMDERQAVILARFDQIESLAVEAYFASMEGKRTYQKNKQIERARSKDRMNQLLKQEKERRQEVRDSDKSTRNKKVNELFIDTGELADILVPVAEKIQKNFREETNEAGDPKFLNIIFAINRERAKILGLYNRREDSNGDRDAVQLTDEQRQARVATIISAAKERRSQQANMLADPAPLGGFEESNGHTPVPKNTDDDWGFDESDVVGEVEWD